MFFHAKSVPEPRWSTSAVRRVRDGLVCGRIMFGYVRIMLGSFSDRFRIVNGVSSVFRACVVDRIPLWFATAGLFPQCKWDCKWCCRMSCRWNSIVICNCRMLPSLYMALQVVLQWRSCRWSFGGSLARNAFLRDSRCTKAYVFPYKVRSRTSMIYLCCATGARRSRVWSDHVRICSDHARIMLGSVPHCKWGVKCFSCICGRQNSIVICNCGIVPAM